jgi:WD40 repeat protein
MFRTQRIFPLIFFGNLSSASKLQLIVQVGSEDGHISVFDLSVNTFSARQTLDMASQGQPISALAFSPVKASARWLAVSVQDTVQLYSVSRSLVGDKFDCAEGLRYFENKENSRQSGSN